tara:strand:- start:10907 stop:12364 length:1458 start_codon:yes stop_codon:yes gene_type:complete
MKPIGSEKLPVNQKIKRIMEIANFGVSPREDVSDVNTTLEYSVKAADGMLYGIERNKSNYVIKVGLNESTLDYIGGLHNSKKYTFGRYSEAMKKLNLIMKPLNESHNDGGGFSLISEQEKFVLKTKDEETEDLGGDFGSEEESFDDTELGGEEESFDDVDLEGEEGDAEVSMDVEVEDDGPFVDRTKTIQKLTGKLGQKLRDLKDDVDADLIKYVINSVIAAVNLDLLDDEDVEEIVGKFESDEEMDYEEEGEVDLEMTGEEEFEDDGEDFGGEEMDMDLGGEEELGEGHHEGAEELDEFWAAAARVVAPAVAAYAGEKLVDKMMDEQELGEDIDSETIEDETEVEDDEADIQTITGIENSADAEAITADAVSQINQIFATNPTDNVFESNDRVSRTLKKYFVESPKEKQVRLKEASNYLKNKISTTKRFKKLNENYTSVEQEIMTKKIVKRYPNLNFVGKKGNNIVLESNKKVIEVSPKGQLIY